LIQFFPGPQEDKFASTMTFANNPFQRITGGATFSRSFAIFMERYDLFLVLSGMIFIPLALMTATITHFIGSSMATMTQAMDTTYYEPDSSADSYAYDSTNYYDSSANMDSITADFASNMASNMAAFGGQLVLEYILLMIVSIAGRAAMAYAVAEMYAGRDPNWRNCLKLGFSRWCDLFGAAFLVGFGIGFANGLVQAIFMLLLYTQSTIVAILASVGILAWHVVIIFVLVSLMILAPVIMVEGQGPIKSIKRSLLLSWNNRCYIFCTVFCLALVGYTMQVIIALILYSASPSLMASGFGAVISLLPALIFVPLAVIIETVVYMNIRVQFEGLNLDVLVHDLDGDGDSYENNDSKYALIGKNIEGV